MSSQSAAVGSGAGQIPKGPRFSRTSIRDSSDWISYKKQLALYYANRTTYERSSIDPFPVYNNNTRLTFLQGKFKQPTAGSCTSCAGPNFKSDEGIPL
jgi:hypothetical protein